MNPPQPSPQQGVRAWFDGTYRDHGFAYLRPMAAYPIFLQLLDAQPGERLLDIGCGPGLLLKAALLRGVEPHGVDISEVAVGMARKYVPESTCQVANAEALPFTDDSFDLLTCIGAFERMLDRRLVLDEMQRVIRPGGRLCLMVRNATAPGWRIWRQLLGRQNHAGHQDAKGLREWREMFESVGLTIDAVHMDQWGRQKLRRWLRGGRHPDFSQPEPIARPWVSIHNAYEYIFLLRS